MPDIKTDDGCIIHVEVEGPQDGPVLMLSNSLGTNLHMWEDQVPAWSRHFRLIRYDRRGHGKSSVPKGRYTMERLGRDVLAVLDALAIPKDQLVRPVDGRYGWAMARRQCAKPCR
jgi:3-oxoadipate enol-lactonase